MASSVYARLNPGIRTLLRNKVTTVVRNGQARFLNLMEFESKKLLAKNGLTVQRFQVADSALQSEEIVKHFKAKEYVVKAQILAGGRGKGTFDSGFKGGVHVTQDASQVPDLVLKMIGSRLITKQTPQNGILVRKVMVAESVTIDRENYVAILMDREHNGPVLVASPDGGMDIEEVAKKTPERIRVAANEIKRMYEMFLKVDATQVEINPLAETNDGQVVCVDAKINFDDNAEFRQKEIFALNDTSESDPREVEAARHQLNYIGMDGNIACLVNGAGLAMATMDIIKLHGGLPANFLDVGGNVNEEQVFHAFRILTSDPSVRSILVNVFGGIVNCETIANGIVNASKLINLQVPLVVRLEGTNVEQAKLLLKKSGLQITSAEDLEDAARKAVASIRN